MLQHGEDRPLGARVGGQRIPVRQLGGLETMLASFDKGRHQAVYSHALVLAPVRVQGTPLRVGEQGLQFLNAVGASAVLDLDLQ